MAISISKFKEFLGQSVQDYESYVMGTNPEPSEMVKRAAAAVAKKLDWFSGDFDGLPVMERARAEVIARTVIEAMREPTDEMIEASNRLDRISGGILQVPIPEHSWQAMIDSALKD